MTIEQLTRLSGLSLALGGLLGATGWLLFALLDPNHSQYSHARWLPLNGLIIAAGVLMALGLPGVYLRQATESGLVGLIGFVILFVGIVLAYLAVHAIETATMPNLPPTMMRIVAIAAPSLFIGAVLTGIATWRSGVYTLWAAALLLAAALLGLMALVLPLPNWLYRAASPAMFCMALAWLGLASAAS